MHRSGGGRVPRGAPAGGGPDAMLFEPGQRFEGLPLEGFAVFEIPERDRRRRAIVDAFHPALTALGQDLVERLEPESSRPLHAHLPRLDWPRSYQPFCTWLALSHEAQGYQARAQLNVGVHRDYVALRLGWDTRQDAFGRFEFLCLHGGMGRELAEAGAEHGLSFRVYAAAAWPEGSRLAFESPTEWTAAFEVTRMRGVWFELGVRYDLPADAELIASNLLGREAVRVFSALLPLYERI